MQLYDLKFNRSRMVMVSVHGKEYPIYKHSGKERYYIQHSKGQLTVTELVNKQEGDYVFNYIFGGQFQTHPCHAMDYWIYRHRMKNRITPNQYRIKFNVKVNYPPTP